MNASLPLAGRYRFLRRLRGTASGVIWLASDSVAGRTVVVSSVTSARVSGLKPAVGLRHPHLATILDFFDDISPGQIPGNISLRPGMAIAVAEHVAGQTLHERLEAGATRTHRAVAILSKLAAALRALHEQGAVHGALSPRSVIIARNDGGIAPIVTNLRAAANGAYCSPERVQGGGPSPQDDTWALHATLYAALTGESPYRGRTREELARTILFGAVPDITRHGVSDPELQDILQHGLRREMSARRTSVTDLEKGLLAWLQAQHTSEPDHPSFAPARAGTIAPPSIDDEDVAAGHRKIAPASPASSTQLPEDDDDDDEMETIQLDASSILAEAMARQGAPVVESGDADDPSLADQLPTSVMSGQVLDEMVERIKVDATRTRAPLPSETRSMDVVLSDLMRKASAVEPDDAGWVDVDGVDADGVDVDGVDVDSVDADGVDVDGVDVDSVDADGVDADGVNADGVDAGSVDADSLDAGSLDAGSLDADGMVPEGQIALVDDDEPATDQLAALNPQALLESPPEPERAHQAEVAPWTSPEPGPPAFGGPVPHIDEASVREVISATQAASAGPQKGWGPSEPVPPPIGQENLVVPAVPDASEDKFVDPSVAMDASEAQVASPQRKRRSRIWLVLAGLLLMVFAAALSFVVAVVAVGGSLPAPIASVLGRKQPAPTATHRAVPPKATPTAPVSASASASTPTTTQPTSSSGPAVSAPGQQAGKPPSPKALSEEDLRTCVEEFFPKGTFIRAVPFEYLCKNDNPRKAATMFHRDIVRGGSGAVTEGMKIWSSLSWYELPAVAILRDGCCPGSPPFELPEAGAPCPSMTEALRSATQGGCSVEAARGRADAFAEAVQCMFEHNRPRPYRYRGAIRPWQRMAFESFLRQLPPERCSP